MPFSDVKQWSQLIDASVIHHNIKPAIMRDCGIDDDLYIRRFGDVTAYCDSLTASSNNLIND
ncbi:hypothetical protein WT49_01570 [Burkholderia territorii]|nr:hypothetical protein WT49_01570 [Burkholderia territorii]KWE31618.1 hypothetical protein WT50_30750 [Burkholderia territorii]KWE44758.1 hypothetical protein WT51_20205 [Burkholderia territorii]